MSGNQRPELNQLREAFDQFRKYAALSIALVGIAVAVVLGTMSYFQVEAGEQAVLLRLGVPTGNTYGPGLHFKVPIVDNVYKADVKKVHQLEFGFRTTRAGVQSEFDEQSYDNESLMLTGDLSLVIVQWTVFYRIADPEKYFFQVRDVEETIRDISEAAVRLLVGDRSNDEVMTEHRAQIVTKGRDLIQEKLDRCDSGIFVERVALRQVDPPEAAKAAFNKVNDARARQQQLVEQAKRARVEAVEAAKGERDGIVASARGSLAQTVESARGEALRFLKLLAEYRKAPAITKRWMYLSAVGGALKQAGPITVLSQSPAGAAGPAGAAALPASDILKVLPLAPFEQEPMPTPAASKPSRLAPNSPAPRRSAPTTGGNQ